MARMLCFSAAIACPFTPAVAQAAPMEFVEQRESYWIFEDVDGALEGTNWYNRTPFFEGYEAMEAGFLAVHPDDSQFIVMYTTFDLQGATAFYQSVSNDVEGIGYQHIADSDPVIPAEIFDDTPNSMVSGFMHMSNWQNYFERDGAFDESFISLVFGQELGHAWLAFPYFDDGSGPSGDMLGRQVAHWSFYMHTGGSPIQGHQWTDNGDGTFTAAKLDRYQFSDLDLYLMGLIPADQVEPWFLIEDPRNCVDSSRDGGACADPGSHQFDADQYRVTGERRDITIEDVIRAEGMRSPAYPNAPDTYDISFILVKRPGEELAEEDLDAIDRMIDFSIDMWEDQTRGLGDIINRTSRDPDPGDSDGDTGGGGDTEGTGTTTSGSGGSATDSGGSTGGETTVGDPTGGSTSDGEGGTGGAGSGGTDDSAGADEGGDQGCGCRAEGSSAPVWALLGPIGLLLGARRRGR